MKKVLDKSRSLWYTTQAVLRRVHHPKATAKTVRTIQGNSSAGRAAVSKTACRGFESFFPCQFSGAFGKLIKRNFRGFSSFGRARPCQGRGGGFEPRNPLHVGHEIPSCPIFIRRHSQAVRQRSAKPSFPSSILGGASMKKHLQLQVLFPFYSPFGE